MKVNEAPDKIYLTTFGFPICEPIPQDSSNPDTVWSENPYTGADSIEYTRTDAFIEKALDYIENNIYDHYDGDHEYGICSGYVKREEFIDEFRKYMEGE